jgi:hypothetical protein
LAQAKVPTLAAVLLVVLVTNLHTATKTDNISVSTFDFKI